MTCVGVFPLIKGNLTPHLDKNTKFHRLKLTGRMVSERFHTIDSTDYNERFDVETAESVS